MLMTTFYILYNTVEINPNIVGYKFTLYTVFYIKINMEYVCYFRFAVQINSYITLILGEIFLINITILNGKWSKLQI